MIETTATILRRKSLTHDIIEFVLLPEELISFVPGQYIMIQLETPEGRRQYRTYSLAYHATDADNTYLRIIVKILDGGLASEFLRDKKPGDLMTIRGAGGLFTFKSPDAQNIYFICTGTGVVPLMSILEHELANGNQSNFVLLFGNRYRVDIFWKDELDELQARYPNFRYEIILSKPDGVWGGKKGYVTDLMDDTLDYTAGHFYLCGHPDMIEGARAQLMQHDVDTERIFEEKYVSVGKVLEKRTQA